MRVLAIAGVLVALGLSGCFERLAFAPAAGTPYPTPTELCGAKWRDVYFSSRNGLRLHGWRIDGARPNGEKPRAVVVHAHGNAGNMGNQLIPALGMCLEEGCDALMFDYRSYGLSEKGGLSRHAAVDDLAGALAFARAEFPDTRILLLGQSMGGATAALAMREEPLRVLVDGLCLVSAFADWNVEVCDVLKSNPITWIFAYPLAYTLISPFRAEPKEGLASWPPQKPLLIIHGKDDTVVPFHHLEIFAGALSEEARARAQLLALERGNHNELAESPQEGEAEVRAALKEWIARSTSTPQ